MKTCHATEAKDYLLLAIVALGTYLVAGRIDLLEKLVALSQRYEAYEIDELIIVCIALAFCQAVLLHRKRDALQRKNARLERQHRELREAMAEIRQLKGIIPICATCKRIRDDEGYWHQVESYLSAHSDAQFTHGVCPDCMEKLRKKMRSEKP